jgi:hypothetical protein
MARPAGEEVDETDGGALVEAERQGLMGVRRRQLATWEHGRFIRTQRRLEVVGWAANRLGAERSEGFSIFLCESEERKQILAEKLNLRYNPSHGPIDSGRLLRGPPRNMSLRQFGCNRRGELKATKNFPIWTARNALISHDSDE